MDSNESPRFAAAGRCRSGQDRYPTRDLRLVALWGEGAWGRTIGVVCLWCCAVRPRSMCDVVARRRKALGSYLVVRDSTNVAKRKRENA